MVAVLSSFLWYGEKFRKEWILVNYYMYMYVDFYT